MQPPAPVSLARLTSLQEFHMRALVPRNPLARDVFDFRRDFDQMLNRFLGWGFPQEEQNLREGFLPAIETCIDKDGRKFQCQIVLPGVDPKDVDIQVQRGILSISGNRSSSRTAKESDYLHREITYGSFHRQIELPEGVDKEKLTAEYRNGILEISAPISAASLPRKIEVKALAAARSAGA